MTQQMNCESSNFAGPDRLCGDGRAWQGKSRPENRNICRVNEKLETRYFKARGAKVETQIDTAMAELGVDSDDIIKSPYLSQGSQNEQDRIVVVGSTLISLEAKSKMFRPPKLNIEKGAQLISDDFRKKSGIQGGCDQIDRL